MLGIVRIVTELLGTPEDTDDTGTPDDTEAHMVVAARSGDVDALTWLGSRYSESDPAQAEWWYRRGAEAGSHDAMEGLSILLSARGRTEDAAEWWRRARSSPES